MSIMDKKRIGEYLKKLRQQKKKGGEKSFTQSDLAEEFLINYDRERQKLRRRA